MRIRRLVFVVSLVVGAWAPGGFGPAHAAPPQPSNCPPGQTAPSYPPGSCRLNVEPTTVSPGGTVAVSGCGFGPGSRVTLTLVPSDGSNAIRLGRTVVDSADCVDTTLTIPRRTKPGTYVIKATGKDASGRNYQLVSDTVTIATQAAQINADLAAAHSDGDAGASSPLAATALALALVLVGSQSVLCVRRRRRAG